jgi:hypothetical protein
LAERTILFVECDIVESSIDPSVEGVASKIDIAEPKEDTA